MNPANVRRDRLQKLADLPNIGPAMARDLELLGIPTPQHLVRRDALTLYRQLCRKTGSRHDPCVLDVLMSVTHFMDGGPARPWWTFTAERKSQYGVDLR